MLAMTSNIDMRYLPFYDQLAILNLMSWTSPMSYVQHPAWELWACLG